MICGDGTDGAVYYDLGPRELQGLERYRQEALDLGLAEPGNTPAFFGSFAPTEPVSEGEIAP